MSEYDAILFDFDGVLADTEPLHWRCWCHVLEPLGIHLDRTTYDANCIGIADRDLLSFFLGLGTASPGMDRLVDAYERKRALYQSVVATENPIPPDIINLIKTIDFLKMGIVSSSHLCDIEPLLARAGLRNRFGALVCAEQVSRRKPEPDGYILAARILQATSPLVVEDSEPGEAAARAAGFNVIRVSGPSDVPEAVRRHL